MLVLKGDDETSAAILLNFLLINTGVSVIPDLTGVPDTSDFTGGLAILDLTGVSVKPLATQFSTGNLLLLASKLEETYKLQLAY